LSWRRWLAFKRDILQRNVTFLMLSPSVGGLLEAASPIVFCNKPARVFPRANKFLIVILQGGTHRCRAKLQTFLQLRVYCWGQPLNHPVRPCSLDKSMAAERGGGGGKLPRALRFWGPLEIFCWDLVIFLGEIFPRKGQDIWFEIGAPKKNLPRAPAKLSAALDKSIL
jgi:hypothetical protein